jgi:hypothetical protein
MSNNILVLKTTISILLDLLYASMPSVAHFNLMRQVRIGLLRATTKKLLNKGFSDV